MLPLVLFRAPAEIEVNGEALLRPEVIDETLADREVGLFEFVSLGLIGLEGGLIRRAANDGLLLGFDRIVEDRVKRVVVLGR